MPTHQFQLSLIQHEVNNSVIEQRAQDGYINATELCKAAGKKFNDYSRLEATVAYLAELSKQEGLPVIAGNPAIKEKQPLIESRPGSPAAGGGTWVHPQVAINLGQWLSAEFAVKVSRWVYDWMSGKGSQKQPGVMPYHIRRHMLNLNQVPAGYFSVLQEMTFILIGPLDQHGYELPEKMVPDISMGKFLCRHLRDSLGVDTDALPVYLHRYPDGRVVEAKLYPESLLAEFRRLIREEWLPKKAATYFAERAPAALPYLDQVIRALPGPATAANAPKLRAPTKKHSA